MKTLYGAIALSLLLTIPVAAQHVDPAAVHDTHSLTFARHVDTAFAAATADQGLPLANLELLTCDSEVAGDQDVGCQVTLQRTGALGTFGATGDGLDVATTNAEIQAVMGNGAAYVKVITSIQWCGGPPSGGTIIGCAPTGSTLVIVNGLSNLTTGRVLVHEFGHNQGLPHRSNPGNPIMAPFIGGNEVNVAEAAAFHNGTNDGANGPLINLPPTIDCPSNVTVECTQVGGTPSGNAQLNAFFANVSGDDGCEDVTITDNAPALFPEGPTVVTFTATDSGGATATCQATVTVRDTTDPVVVCPANIVVECTAHDGTPATDPAIAAFLAAASATDICDPTLVVTHNAGAFFDLGPNVVTFTATDDDLNSSQCTATVTVVDTTPPVISCPADITVECSSFGGTPSDDPQLTGFFAGVGATDVCDDHLVITNDAPPLIPDGEATVVTFTATDASNNAAQCTATVTVVDTTPPVFSISINRDVLWPPNHKMTDIVVTVDELSDICDPNPTVTLVSITSDELPDGQGDGAHLPDWAEADFGTDDREFQLRAERSGLEDGRTYTISYLASDHSGNTTPAELVVRVPHNQPIAAKAGAGYDGAGTGLDPAQETFLVLIPGTVDVGVDTIVREFALVGNTAGVAAPRRYLIQDQTGDGRADLALEYKVFEVLELQAASKLIDGPLGLQFRTSGGQDCLVADIFALGNAAEVQGWTASRPVREDAPSVPEIHLTQSSNAEQSPELSKAELPQRIGLLGIQPNPFNPSTTIHFTLARAGAARITIHNLQGERVRRLELPGLPAGEHAITWNGHDQHGRAVASGVYLVVLDAAGIHDVMKAVLTK